MNKNDFIKLGYKEFPIDTLEKAWANVFLQKRFDDELGKKYFINVYFPKSIPSVPEELTNKPDAKAQFTLECGTVNLELFHFDSIETMEAFFEKAFIDVEAEYYE